MSATSHDSRRAPLSATPMRKKPGGQKLDGRRGQVFAIRIAPAELDKLKAAHAPTPWRPFGPWLLERALASGTTPPAAAGTTRSRLAAALGTTRAARRTPTCDRVILDLCSGSGAWSAPYADVGYRVTRVDLPTDVRTWKAPRNVWGILAAPPCDQFSLARNGERSGPRRILEALSVVHACLAVVALTRPVWWALENPVGLLSKYLGTPRDVWQPHEFGDPWTKRTAVWGDYVVPARGPHVKPVAGGGPLCPCNGKVRVCWRPSHRAVTPSGFARAFFEANP